MNRQWCHPRRCQMELISAPSLPSFGTQPCAIAELRAVNEAAALQQQNVPHEAEPPPPPPPVLMNESHCQLPWATDADMRQAIQQADAECAVTLTPEQREEDERRARRAAYTKRWSPEPHAHEAGLVLGEGDYDDAADLEASWEKGTGWIFGRWQYSEEEQEALRKHRVEDARIRSELRRLNEEVSYESVSCVPLSNSAISFLDYLEAAAAPDAAAAARDGPPTPKPLPPSAPPAPTQAQAASEAALSVDGVRRTP